MPARNGASALAAEALSKTYPSAAGPLAVLEDISFAVPPGALVTLLGPSGAGKTTLLNVLAGLEAPDRGRVWLRGRPLAGRPPIAYMQQKDLLLPWRSLWDNILLGPELRSRAERARLAGEARRLVHAFHLDGFTGSYPAQLSGGMRQRAALIRTLLCEQDILLLDEPFGAVDALTRRRLQRHLLEVWETLGKTIVLVTHDVEEAVLLSTEILLLTPRPGRLQERVPVTVPHRERPRSPETLRLKTHILQRLDPDEAVTYA